MENAKQQVVDRLKQANNILVTVKNDPSIDLLSACIGLSLVLGKLDKHAAAVFSGVVPSAMEFLKPEETIERTPDSLRDFIIALDRAKADKLRYKVEDKVVRIFITPYRTSLSQDDLEFSQGDFNIDVVVALGAHEQTELDAAITAQGRILHDASIISINNTANGNLGALNWQEISASSVSEMITDLAMQLGDNVLDEQIATALLTGVVAETARFSNDKTTPQTMRIAGELMAAGANQQLVADELRKNNDELPHETAAPTDTAGDPGTLQIDHTDDEPPVPETPPEAPQPGTAEQKPEAPDPTAEREILPMPNLDTAGSTTTDASVGEGLLTGVMDDEEQTVDHGFLIDQQPEPGQTAPNPFASTPEPEAPILTHGQAILPPSEEALAPPAEEPAAPAPEVVSPAETTEPALSFPLPEVAHPEPTPEPSSAPPAGPAPQTLEAIEASVQSAHLAAEPDTTAADNLDDARMQVLEALRQGPQPLNAPPAGFNSHPFGPPLHEDVPAEPMSTPQPEQSMFIDVDHDGNITPAAAPTLPPAPTAPSSFAPDTLPPALPLMPDHTSLSPAPGLSAPVSNALDMPLPPVMPGPGIMPSPQPLESTSSPEAPPPVPPPMMPPNFM